MAQLSCNKLWNVVKNMTKYVVSKLLLSKRYVRTHISGNTLWKIVLFSGKVSPINMLPP